MHRIYSYHPTLYANINNYNLVRTWPLTSIFMYTLVIFIKSALNSLSNPNMKAFQYQ